MRARRLEAIGSDVLAGMVAGALVGGLGGRLAMRLSGALSDPVLIGAARTENGNVVGAITAEGTAALVLFAGVFSGVFGGLLYAAIRPWTERLGRWRGLAFGSYLVALLGAAVVFDPTNRDFRAFGPPVVNVLAFAALFLFFGLAIVPLSGITARVRGRGHAIGTALRAASWLALVPAALLLTFGTAEVAASLRGATSASNSPSGVSSLMGLATVVLGFALRALRATPPVGLVVLAVPLVIGAYTTAAAVIDILTR